MNLFALLIHHSLSAADKLFEKTGPGCFSTSNTEAFGMLAWNGKAEISDIFEKEDILEKSVLKQIIHEVSMNYFLLWSMKDLVLKQRHHSFCVL